MKTDQRTVNQIKEGFRSIDENGIYKYVIMIASVSEEYKFSAGASKTMFRYTQFPVVSDLDINYSHIKSPVYIPAKFHYAQNNVYSFSLKLQSISKYAINCETGVTYMDGFAKIMGNSLRNSRVNVNTKLVYKKGNIDTELSYLTFYDKIVNQEYIRQSLKLKAEYTIKKLVVGIEGNNIENIFGVFDNTAYNTRYSILNGITQITVLNEAISYLILKLKYNFYKEYTLIDIGIVAYHFCLKARDLGLGTCMIGWFNEKKVKQLLGIPSSKRVPLLITVGYRSGEVRKKTRKKLSDIYSIDKY